MKKKKLENLSPETRILYRKLTELQKQVAWNVLCGMNNTDAYKNAPAGKAKDENTKHRSANSVVTNCKVKAFMDAARDEFLDQEIMTCKEAQARLSNIGRGSLSELVEFGTYKIGDTENGEEIIQTSWVIKDSAQSDPDMMSNISKLTAGKEGLKIELFSPIQAIEKLSVIKGWNKPKKMDITSGGRSWAEFCGQGEEEDNKDNEE